MCCPEPKSAPDLRIIGVGLSTHPSGCEGTADDPFDTAGLRAAVLRTWRDSPTRLREDAATEADLVQAGYRDRLLTELAQNAADAAVIGGVPGNLVVRLDGRSLSVANTGAPLDIAGVQALTALRASGKSDVGAVGRFGVGFTAVRTVGDEIELRSVTGSVCFSLARTEEMLRQHDIPTPDEPGWTAPVLRLVWPGTAAPAAGADSEIIVRLRDGVDAEELFAAMRRELVDLLVELPALRTIRVGDEELTANTRALDPAHPDLTELRITGPETERVWWQYRVGAARWLLPVRDGVPVSAAPDVLRAPTRSDEELSLPAWLVADIPMQPDRRRVLPAARIEHLATGYADFARALSPEHRLIVVPVPGFARSAVDTTLREAIVRELREQSWLPVVPVSNDVNPPDTEYSGLRDAVAAPVRASAFAGLTVELADLLAAVVGPLVIPTLSGNRCLEALSTLDVHLLGLARIAEFSSGIEREPEWWSTFYSALEPFVDGPLAVEELGALAVPLADGRLVSGPRTVVLDEQLQLPIPVHWARLVHPTATHPLLARLGARQATATDLLSDPGLHDTLAEDPADPDTVDAVLQLAGFAEAAELPDWLGLLELPDAEGGLLPADELLVPHAPIRDLLISDSPFGTLAPEIVEKYGTEAVRAVGAVWDFALVTESDPTGPDHHLDAEEQWWAELDTDPDELVAVRDLDLVDEVAWPRALHRLLTGEHTHRLLADAHGYTAWWLRTHARIDARPLGLFRHPDDFEFAGLLPAFSVPGLGHDDIDTVRAVLADPDRITNQLAAALLAALADPAKTPSPQVTTRAHARLAAAIDHLDLTALDPPNQVRALSGAVVDPGEALVLDQPWFGMVLPSQTLVVGDTETAPALAALLDLSLVSETVAADVLDEGQVTSWTDEPLGVLFGRFGCAASPDAVLVVHDELRVRVRGPVQRTVSVPWWREGETIHIQGPDPYP